jgi:hypothetical protein
VRRAAIEALGMPTEERVSMSAETDGMPGRTEHGRRWERGKPITKRDQRGAMGPTLGASAAPMPAGITKRDQRGAMGPADRASRHRLRG